jgi:type I restriction enzyme S subunit
MDSEDLTIRRKGLFATDDVGPAFIRLFKPGQILYGSRRTYLKKVAVADFEGICSNTTFVLETKDENKLRQRLLPFIMLTDDFTKWSISKSKGSTNPYILFSDLANYEFELPDINKQDELVKLLWQAYATKESYREMIRATDEMVKSQFIELVQRCNPEKKTLESICTRGPQNGFYRKGADIDGTIPIVKMSQLFGFESMSDVSHFDLVSLTEDEIRRFSLTENDLLFGRRSLVPEGAGKCRRAGRIDKTVVFESSILRVSIDPAICYPRFVQAWTESPEGEQAISELRAGTSVVGITGSGLSKVIIPVPTKSIQDVFIGVAEQADKSKFELKQAIEKIDKVMRALMQ